MWQWILAGVGLVLVVGAVYGLIRRRATPDQDLAKFLAGLTMEFHGLGPEYRVRGMVPGAMTVVLSLHGQEVAVPLDNVFHHYLQYPEQLPSLARQLVEEIEEVALEQPADRLFSDCAMQIMPQVCQQSWVEENAPVFGGGALVQRDLGPELRLCYVVDDPWAMVFVCREHLAQWGRTEDDLFHLACQNLRQRTGGLSIESAGVTRVHRGDGYDAARVLLLDPEEAEGLLVAMPERDSLWVGGQEDASSLEDLLRDQAGGRAAHPVSNRVYRVGAAGLEPVTAGESEPTG